MREKMVVLLFLGFPLSIIHAQDTITESLTTTGSAWSRMDDVQDRDLFNGLVLGLC